MAFPLFLLLLNWAQRRTRAEWPAIGAMLALSAAAGLRVLHATSSIAGSGAGFGATQTPWTYFTAQGVAILRYLRLLIVPYPLTVDPQIDATPLAAGVAWLAVAAAIALAIRFARSFAPATWFLGGLLLLAPSSSFLPADDLAADRRLYLPMLAFAACLALLAERLPWKRASLAFVAMLCGLLVWQVHHWTSERLLWQQAVDWAPDKVRPRIQLACAAATPAESARILDEAAARFPANADIPNESGRIQLESGNVAEALSSFGRALALSPNNPLFLNNRGVALAALGQSEAARADFRRALAVDPCLRDAHDNLTRAGAESRRPPSCP